VVHRDIKPTNVLVTTEGQVKLLDFGIAKLLASDTDFDTRTEWHRPLTPEYATPEQVLGEPITTSTDVYQLGLLLYELLTGERAYRFERRDSASMRRAICEQDVQLPSRVADPARQGELRGNLDAIVRTALQRDPATCPVTSLLVARWTFGTTSRGHDRRRDPGDLMACRARRNVLRSFCPRTQAARTRWARCTPSSRRTAT